MIQSTETLAGPLVPAPAKAGSSPRRLATSRADVIYQAVSFAAALGLVVTLMAVVGVVLTTAWPAIGRLGFGFLTGADWNTGSEVYGALPFLSGTLITTAMALILAVPVSLGIAILSTEYLPGPLAAALGVVIDVAAGVPTIVFGAWTLLSLTPWLRTTGEPAVYAVLGWLPFFGNPNHDLSGLDIFGAGLVLAAMVFPTIVAVTRNSFLATPLEMREASLGLGATRWETATRVVLRQARSGLLGAMVLASGRAIGETMALAFIIGTSRFIPRSVFDQGATLSTELLTDLYGGGAVPGRLYTGALYELGLVLLGLSLLTSVVGRLLTRRLVGSVVGRGR